MQDIGYKLNRMAAVVVVFMFFCLGSAWAQFTWQTGDLVACYGTGNGGGSCNVFRIDNTNHINFLNSLNDNSSAATTATAINNSLHLLVTDGGSGTSSVVQYSIASINPFTGATVPHATTTFNSSGGPNSKNAQAIAINNGGHMFVGNSGSGGQASIVELDAHGATTGKVYSFSSGDISGDCPTTALNSLDLSADGKTIYVTSGDVNTGGDGKIRAVDISSGLPTSAHCTIFADFGPGVSLFGIKDIPAGALSGNCLVNSCPNGESVLVVANGFVDIDSNETENNPPSTDPDAVNVCTNAPGGSAQSCALLLSTAAATPPLSGAVWQAGHIYGTADIGTQIVDAFLHVQKVVSAGKSGTDEPAWSQSGGTVRDNAVVWTDQGQKLWGHITDYPLGAIVVDPSAHVQMATTAGKSASTQPSPWNDSGSTTTDGLIWTDQGQKVWQADTSYSAGAIVVDPAGHVQTVTIAGISGPGPNPPTFSDTGSTTIDGLTWSNQGPGSATAWTPNTTYAAGTTVQDTNGNLEQALTGGTSGAGPTWNTNLNGMTIDNAVTWTDSGGWLANHPYSLGNLVGDFAQHLQKVTTAGISGPGPNPPAFNDSLGTTPDNAVVWTDHGTWIASNLYSVGDLAGDNSNHLQKVTTAGFSGPGPNPPAFNDFSGTATDGLQWQDQSTSPNVVARYQIGSQSGLQAVALDPLVSNCMANSCPTLPFPNRKIQNANQPLSANFWLADTGSGDVFKVPFLSGLYQTYHTDTAANCPGGHCGIGLHSIVIYGGESAAQPGLASLLLGGSLTSPNFTATQTILNNTITSTLSGSGLSTTPIALYASLVPTSSCFNDSNVGSLPCKETVSTAPGNALVWKIDIPQGQAQALPLSQTLNSAFSSAPNSFGIDNGTDVFVDMAYDDTTFVGGDPGTRTVSVHSLHEVPGVTFAQSGCRFSSPLPNTCYKLNRTTLNFTFSCPGLSIPVFDSLKPLLSLVKKDPNHVLAPQFIPVAGNTATNGKPAFRLNASQNIYTYQLNLTGFAAGTYLGTAFDQSNQVQSFTTQTFTLSSTCK